MVLVLLLELIEKFPEVAESQDAWCLAVSPVQVNWVGKMKLGVEYARSDMVGRSVKMESAYCLSGPRSQSWR